MPEIGSPAARSANWQAPPHARPDAILQKLRTRIASARDLRELTAIATELADARSEFEREGLMRRPPPGDADVKDTIKTIITEPLGVVEQIVVSTVWTSLEEDVEHGLREACADAAFEVFKAILKRHFGEFATEAAAAIKERNVGAVLKAAKAAAEAVVHSLADREGLLREALQVLRRNGVILDKSIESVFRKWLMQVAGKVVDFFSSLATLWTAPVTLALRVFFTPTNVVDDRGELYLFFDLVSRELQDRVQRFMPPAPSTTDWGAVLKVRPTPGINGVT